MPLMEPAQPPQPPRCPHCRYSLTGLPRQGVCPECGGDYDTDTLGPGEGPARDQRRRTLTRIDIVATAILATLFVLLFIFLILLFPPG